ncbi:glycosyltransferase family 87 protein [Rickettsiella endosymbiont of Miltochrista miniata]|uniref:ArnT family glycosyltransferase n=1 Tax=Rickettsiella endosymbiont of Miltochrista miniata TaxID=3066239 RepID=UPI00313EF48F
MKVTERLFPACQLGKSDYFVGGLLLLFCYVAFFQSDIYVTGWNSLNYLFGNPLEFYDNCKKIQGHGDFASANYPPTVFAIFAVWLYPFKLFGLIKSPFYFSPYLVYWLKLLTSLVYLATGLLFYQVTQVYQKNEKWGVYATWLWLTSPIAIFSQFIFSQYDIFYVFLTLFGFLIFLKKQNYLASFLFGLAITFKYFPFFVFIPLLLFFEKKIIKLILCGLIFLIPTFIIQALYIHSSAYISGVLGFSVIARVFSAGLIYGGQKIYYIFAIFSILVGIAYYLDNSYNYKKIAGFIFLFSSIFPFLFMLWHPQWLIFITPAMVLTTVLSSKDKISKFLIFDLCAMVFFIGFTVLSFQDNVDLAMFQGKLFNFPLKHFLNISILFNLFKGFSSNVYLSLFWGYLVLQFILKYKFIDKKYILDSFFLYNNIRQRYYIGILIFLIPAIFMFIINFNNKDLYILSTDKEKNFGELTASRIFEQKFIAENGKLKQVDLFLSALSRQNNNYIQLEILNRDRKQLITFKRPERLLQDNGWESFKFKPITLKKGELYFLRLTSPKSYNGNAITWLASAKPTYIRGAIVDGVPQNTDFTFKLRFENI